MVKRTIFIVVLLATVCFVNCSYAGSIWAKRSRDMRKLYVDDVARQIGDILTITIDEDSEVEKKTSRDNEKTTDRSTTFTGELGIVTKHKGLFQRIPGFTMGSESSNTLGGSADYKDERTFTDSITVVVIDILPNGNLVVLGTRDRNIVGDIQVVEVSGIVRPSDIAFDNTVASEQVANFRIVVKNGGPSELYNEQGWLGNIFDIIWPF